MKPKAIVTAALLALVGAAIGAAVVRGLRPAPRPQAQPADGDPGQKGAEAKAPELLADGVIAFYFHGDQRCPTCKKIEACAEKAVREGFPVAIKQGRLQWLVLNYDQPQHAHFKEDYGIAAPMVVLVQRAGGQDVRSVNMVEVWPLVVQGDTEGCVDYVRAGVKRLLDASGPGG
jgi:hypothetical protein